MCEMLPGYLDKRYAGWLGKVIGIRLGAPIEGFTSDRIDHLYGLLHDYPVDYKLFAADDDSNGPFFFLCAQTGQKHFLLARVQGAERNYAFGFDGKGMAVGYTTLQTVPFDWQPDREYRLGMQLDGAHIRCFINGEEVLDFTDGQHPYLHGAIGVGVRDGSHIAVRRLDIH